MGIFLIILSVLIYLFVGLLIMRCHSRRGGGIAMVAYTYPYLALLLMLGCIVLWPIADWFIQFVIIFLKD
jgi:hypothetical protein